MIRTLLAALLLLLAPLSANSTVTAVLFFSGRCPHCHEVIREVLPPLMERYQDRLEVIFVNIGTHLGSELYYEAIATYKVPEDRLGVPTMLIGKQILIGSDEIAQELPEVVGRALNSGGATLPTVAGLAAAMPASEEPPAKRPALTKRPPPVTIATEANLEKMAHPSLWEKLSGDPIGNSLALVLLVIIAVSLIWVPIRWKHAGVRRYGWGEPSSYWLPLLALAGVGISVYMTVIETTEMPAVCGPIGNCNAVQQSPYAYLFGVIPVGLLGIIGYGAIFASWLWALLSPRFPRWILPTLLYGALLFSFYFTVLEPFVIGAACVWCLTSALITILMVWGTTKHGY
ncbi:MAG: vitamin K epoxide reductase family protein [Parachlamydiales bacterium]